MKIILSLIAGAAIGLTAHSLTQDKSGNLMQVNMQNASQNITDITKEQYKTLITDKYTPTGFAGNYLSGFFAQNQHDWNKANDFMKQSLAFDDQDPDLLKRGIVLAIGAKDYESALKRAKKLSETAQDDSIGQLYLTIDAIHRENYDSARTILDEMKSGGIKDFVKPLLQSWLDAEKGIINTEDLRKNSIHVTHGLLISHFIGDNDQTENLLAEAIAIGGLTVSDLNMIAGIYIDLERIEKAEKILQEASKFSPDDLDIKEKLQKIKDGEDIEGFKGIQSAKEGISIALFDMAKLFYQEKAYESAHIFSHMSLMLNDTNIEAKIILADIAYQNERFNEAISYYNQIEQDHSFYVRAQREIARILEDQKRINEAVRTLKKLAKDHKDYRSLIQIGDIHRREDQFPQAIEAYNYAEKTIGSNNIIPDYWHLHYVRGMAYEQNENWELAEKDLLAALDVKPQHPYLLNYLGYSWADQGIHLERATEMIKKAVSLEPRDGYIIDSLGWVLYRQGQYKEAVPHLEKAVELLPYDPIINDHLGDAYWKVGRKIEARFQWERAKNHIEDDDTLLADIQNKLQNGLQIKDESIFQAETQTENDENKLLNP